MKLEQFVYARTISEGKDSGYQFVMWSDVSVNTREACWDIVSRNTATMYSIDNYGGGFGCFNIGTDKCIFTILRSSARSMHGTPFPYHHFVIVKTNDLQDLDFTYSDIIKVILTPRNFERVISTHPPLEIFPSGTAEEQKRNSVGRIFSIETEKGIHLLKQTLRSLLLGEGITISGFQSSDALGILEGIASLLPEKLKEHLQFFYNTKQAKGELIINGNDQADPAIEIYINRMGMARSQKSRENEKKECLYAEMICNALLTGNAHSIERTFEWCLDFKDDFGPKLFNEINDELKEFYNLEINYHYYYNVLGNPAEASSSDILALISVASKHGPSFRKQFREDIFRTNTLVSFIRLQKDLELQDRLGNKEIDLLVKLIKELPKGFFDTLKDYSKPHAFVNTLRYLSNYKGKNPDIAGIIESESKDLLREENFDQDSLDLIALRLSNNLDIKDYLERLATWHESYNDNESLSDLWDKVSRIHLYRENIERIEIKYLLNGAYGKDASLTSIRTFDSLSKLLSLAVQKKNSIINSFGGDTFRTNTLVSFIRLQKDQELQGRLGNMEIDLLVKLIKELPKGFFDTLKDYSKPHAFVNTLWYLLFYKEENPDVAGIIKSGSSELLIENTLDPIDFYKLIDLRINFGFDIGDYIMGLLEFALSSSQQIRENGFEILQKIKETHARDINQAAIALATSVSDQMGKIISIIKLFQRLGFSMDDFILHLISKPYCGEDLLLILVKLLVDEKLDLEKNEIKNYFNQCYPHSYGLLYQNKGLINWARQASFNNSEINAALIFLYMRNNNIYLEKVGSLAEIEEFIKVNSNNLCELAGIIENFRATKQWQMPTYINELGKKLMTVNDFPPQLSEDELTKILQFCSDEEQKKKLFSFYRFHDRKTFYEIIRKLPGPLKTETLTFLVGLVDENDEETLKSLIDRISIENNIRPIDLKSIIGQLLLKLEFNRLFGLLNAENERYQNFFSPLFDMAVSSDKRQRKAAFNAARGKLEYLKDFFGSLLKLDPRTLSPSIPYNWFSELEKNDREGAVNLIYSINEPEFLASFFKKAVKDKARVDDFLLLKCLNILKDLEMRQCGSETIVDADRIILKSKDEKKFRKNFKVLLRYLRAEEYCDKERKNEVIQKIQDIFSALQRNFDDDEFKRMIDKIIYTIGKEIEEKEDREFLVTILKGFKKEIISIKEFRSLRRYAVLMGILAVLCFGAFLWIFSQRIISKSHETYKDEGHSRILGTLPSAEKDPYEHTINPLPIDLPSFAKSAENPIINIITHRYAIIGQSSGQKPKPDPAAQKSLKTAPQGPQKREK